jgi:hypothetical protein
MSDPIGKAPMEKYNDAVSALAEAKAKYEAIANKETKTAQKAWDRILRLGDDVNELEKKKDEIVLSKTCIAHLEERVKEHYYGRKKSISTNAMEKGVECESEAVFVLNKALGTDYIKSVYNNGDRMENDRCT